MENRKGKVKTEFVDAVEVSETDGMGAVALRESAREAARARLNAEIEGANVDKLVPDAILPAAASSAPNAEAESEEVADEESEDVENVRVDAESTDPKAVLGMAVANASVRKRAEKTGKFIMKLTPGVIDSIIRSYAFLDSDDEVAAVCGVHRTTIYRLKESNPDVAAQIEASKMTRKAIAKKKLFQGLRNGGFAEALQVLAIEEPEKYSPRAKLDVNNKHSAEGTLADVLSKLQSGEIQQTMLASGAAKQLLPSPAQAAAPKNS